MSYLDELQKRRSLDLHVPSVKEVLPEHFLANYPDLIKFLEAYYQFLDSDQTHNFNSLIQSIDTARDIEDSTITQLNLLLKEIGANIINVNYFRDPRSSARQLANFYRVKGSLYSAEGFFKAFYGIDAEITYPKRDIFIIDQSLIGPDDLALIQDGALYQVLSVLIKTELPISVWGDLYKTFVHPAGFYLGSQVVITSVGTLTFGNMPDVEPAPDLPVTILDVGTLSAVGDQQVTNLILSGSSYIRSDPSDTINDIKDIPIQGLIGMYSTIESLITVTSPTFDQKDSAGTAVVDMSNTIETIDRNKFEWWDSDSDGYAQQIA